MMIKVLKKIFHLSNCYALIRFGKSAIKWWLGILIGDVQNLHILMIGS